MEKKRVLMAMSGGIDSTVAAMLLLEQGYELVGGTYRTFDNISRGCMEKEKGCCSVDSLFEAKRMAQELGFEHHILDIRQEFKDTVITNFIGEYLQGRTPNPCVICNSTIKWGKLIETALHPERGAGGISFRVGQPYRRPLASMETKSPSATMMWSSRRISMVARASRTCRVAARSSADGRATPLG